MAANARALIPSVTLLLLATLVGVCAQASRVRWSDILKQQDVWYGSAEAHAVADNVVRYQRASGGWPKDIDMTTVPAGAPPARPDATIDNGATTTQIRFLARFPESRYREAALKGIDYLLDAQYPSGGWPQFFPLRTDYSRYITFNDNAMTNVLAVLEEAAAGTPPFGFVDEQRRKRAADAVARAVPVILKSQVVVNGTPTVWGAQHDEVTLEPRAARTFEPASLASMESVGLVRFLMQRPKTPAIEHAVDSAIAWFTATRLPDNRWARFYEIGTNRPIFAGRDGIVRYSVDQIEQERRDGYAWYGTWPRELLARHYHAWKSRH
jgi:PelA/Pel-15E family pectate lyase